MRVDVVATPPAERLNSFYCSNRPPLMPSPLIKLPLGAIRPGGWLKHQLDLMTGGMVGRLGEISGYLADNNGWFGGEKPGWEEQPYWFRGFGDLAVLTGDERLLTETDRWLDAVFSSQDTDGYFGASCNKEVVGKNGQRVCDLWPHMVMLDAVIHHHEHTNDKRVIPFMTRFFQFCRNLPEEMFVPPKPKEDFGDWKPFIQRSRAGDMLPHIYWLYNHTGEVGLLDLATRFYHQTAPPQDEWLAHHVVNFTQQFAYPGIYSQQSGRSQHLAATEYWYAQHMATWGQQSRGIFAADECVRPGCVDPRQGFETCAMVEFAKSFYILGRITGDAKYADRCEDVMLNHFPAAQTPDLKALHYLTASNQPQLDASENHEYFNKFRQIDYSPYEVYRCCQHNVAMGWPWYAQNLFQATSDDGLAAWLYGPCEVTAKLGRSGTQVTIRAETDYPFRGQVAMSVETAGKVEFPLYLRVPRWCRGFKVALNGKGLDVAAEPGTYVRIEREWSAGDTITIKMPMEISLTQWPRNGSVTVDRGPLSYSVKIEEDWRRSGGSDDWPEWEVFPKSPWNYGLVIDDNDPAGSLEVIEKDAVADQPWTIEAAPVEIKATGKRIPNWGLENETVEELQVSPIESDQPVEQIMLIPLGCARLRIGCLPVIGDGPDARRWR